MREVIAIDMDDVIADLLSHWVESVNEYEDENVKLEDIKCWNISRYFKCERQVYKYLTYDLFRHLPVMSDSQRVIKNLMEKHDVFIVTSATSMINSLAAKVEWLQEYFPFISSNNIVLCGDKSIIKADIMIDDGIHNLDVFEGRKILFDAPHNRDNEQYERVKSWKEIEKILL